MEQVGSQAAEEGVVHRRITRLGQLNLDVVDEASKAERTLLANWWACGGDLLRPVRLLTFFGSRRGLRRLDGIEVTLSGERNESRRHLAEDVVAELALRQGLQLVLDLVAGHLVRVGVEL